MLEQSGIDVLSLAKRFCGAFEIDHIPERDGGGDEIKPAGPVTLVLEGTVADFAEPIGEDGASQ